MDQHFLLSIEASPDKDPFQSRPAFLPSVENSQILIQNNFIHNPSLFMDISLADYSQAQKDYATPSLLDRRESQSNGLFKLLRRHTNKEFKVFSATTKESSDNHLPPEICAPENAPSELMGLIEMDPYLREIQKQFDSICHNLTKIQRYYTYMKRIDTDIVPSSLLSTTRLDQADPVSQVERFNRASCLQVYDDHARQKRSISLFDPKE